MSTPLLQIENITRSIPATDTVLLSGLSLTIFQGDRIGLSGNSGSGKTTLLRAIARLDPVIGGKYAFQERPIDGLPEYRRQVVYLHQRPAMIAGTVRDNLQLPFTLAASVGQYDEQQVAESLALMGKPTSLLGQSVDTLSGGEQQIVALLRAVQIQPKILLLDEPTASLDSDSTERFEKLVDLWYQRSPDRGLIWVSHDESQLERMTERTINIVDGRITA